MFNPDTQTWSTFVGALHLASVHKLQTLFDAARTFGTEIRLDPVPMSADWQGPPFTADRWRLFLPLGPTGISRSATCPSTERAQARIPPCIARTQGRGLDKRAQAENRGRLLCSRTFQQFSRARRNLPHLGRGRPVEGGGMITAGLSALLPGRIVAVVIATCLLDDLAAAHPGVSKVWADGGYQSSIFNHGAGLGIDVEVVQRPRTKGSSRCPSGG
ncbi:hypothetical protein [Streptomyces sp. NPDC058964]|uniref:hypothetical protein n=1 Tax=Streptomyces sp. NPDC058964 TaxID=3346681 RepID=UPI003696EFD0